MNKIALNQLSSQTQELTQDESKAIAGGFLPIVMGVIAAAKGMVELKQMANASSNAIAFNRPPSLGKQAALSAFMTDK